MSSLTFGGPDNKYLISASKDASIKFFDWETKQEEAVHTIQGESEYGRIASSDSYLAVANDAKEVELYSHSGLNSDSEPIHVFENDDNNDSKFFLFAES